MRSNSAFERTDEERVKHAAYMREYMNDPAHPERRDKKRKYDRLYAAQHRQEALDKATEWYSKNENKRHVAAREAKRRLERKRRAIAGTGQIGCLYCGEDHPATLQFHHRKPEEKRFTISQAVMKNAYSWDEILEEVKKCDLICANCHSVWHSAWNEILG
jgi:lactate dehydrogenase-like 2-hydroxyacid dehydrogenase